MKILFKYPTRDRPLKFSRCLTEYYKLIADKNFRFVVTADNDDQSMNNPQLKAYLEQIPQCEYFFGNNDSKISAINADIPEDDWDILVLVSDDMIPEVAGFDNIIREKMTEHYPDLDGVLWFFDGWRRDLNTLCILGRKYYDRFGYIYHPAYKSFWCDAEFTEVAAKLGKQTFIDQVIIRHLHPDIVMQDELTQQKFSAFLPEYSQQGSYGHDNLWQENGKLDKADHDIYLQRKETGYSL